MKAGGYCYYRMGALRCWVDGWIGGGKKVDRGGNREVRLKCG